MPTTVIQFPIITETLILGKARSLRPFRGQKFICISGVMLLLRKEQELKFFSLKIRIQED